MRIMITAALIMFSSTVADGRQPPSMPHPFKSPVYFPLHMALGLPMGAPCTISDDWKNGKCIVPQLLRKPKWRK